MEMALSLLRELAAKPVDALAVELQDLTPERQEAYLNCLKGLAEVETLSEEEQKGLRAILLALAYAKCHDALPTLCILAKAPFFNKQISEYDWMLYNFHRFLFSIAVAEDYAPLSEIALDETVARTVREQFILFVILGWNSGKVGDNVASSIFSKAVKGAIEKELFDKEMITAIMINVAMLGTKEAKETEEAVFASGILGNEAERMKKAVNSVANQRQYFRNMMLKEQKGLFEDVAAELQHINEKIIEEKRELPGKGHTIVRMSPKVGRNEPCPCGSGKKYKNCCGRNA
ncbi:MAG: SEC-C domain-containing protein [Victivallales bacterium]|nr:SEC-C domain-containing protein [Victivallales bacterium]